MVEKIKCVVYQMASELQDETQPRIPSPQGLAVEIK